mgnify:CR=1 FL=1
MGSGATGVTIASPLADCALASTINIPADDVLVVLDKPIYLMETDILEGGANPATADIFISYEVINDA